MVHFDWVSPGSATQSVLEHQVDLKGMDIHIIMILTQYTELSVLLLILLTIVEPICIYFAKPKKNVKLLSYESRI